jgi:hypothetical protein
MLRTLRLPKAGRGSAFIGCCVARCISVKQSKQVEVDCIITNSCDNILTRLDASVCSPGRVVYTARSALSNPSARLVL